MGTRCLSYPPMPPIFALVFLVLIGVGVGAACDLSMCWTTYQDATNALHSGILMDLVPNGSDDNPECIVIRTYVKCIVKQGHRYECKTNLKYQSDKIGNKRKLKELNCSTNGAVYDPTVNVAPMLPVSNPDSDPFMCSYEGTRNYKHCGLFGDPHLRTFNDEFQTCKVEGAWSLINNKHLTVQVTNDPVVTSGAATATSKLTVVIKKNDDCAAHRFVTYAAQTDHLPGTFDDGRTTYGPDNSVRLYEVEPGKHIKIQLRFIDTTIVVRQIGRYFTFAIKMPQEVINNSREEDVLELCVRGCPKQERINYQKYLAERKNKIIPSSGGNSDSGEMRRSDAVELCRKANVVDFYFDSCVFDLMTTGDKVFTVSAYQAWQDLIDLTPEMQRTQTRRTDLTKYDNMHSSAVTFRTTHASFRILVLTILLLLWHQYRPV